MKKLFMLLISISFIVSMSSTAIAVKPIDDVTPNGLPYVHH